MQESAGYAGSRAHADFAPTDVDYAVYLDDLTPPPDNRGINPTAQFTWQAPTAG